MSETVVERSPARQGVSRNFLALGIGEAAARVIAFAATIYLARTLGAEGYGVIAFAIGINLYLAKIADFGIDAAGARTIAADREHAADIAGAVTVLRVAFACALAAFAILIYLLLLPEPERSVLTLYAITLVPIAAATRWVHVGLESAGAAGVARVLGESAVLVIVVLLVGGYTDIWIVPVAQVTGEVIVALWLRGALVRKGVGPRLRWDPRAAWPVFARGFPLLFHVLLGLVIYNSDLIFIRILKDRAEVGYYAAAYALISFAANIGMTYSMSLLPALSRLKAAANDAGGRALNTSATAQAFAVTLAVAVGGSLLAADIIGLGFGPDYAPASTALAILLWSVPFSTLKLLPWVGLIAHEQGSRATAPMAWAVVVNLMMNIALVPPFGIAGAAVATVVTEAVCWALMYREALRAGVPGVPMNRLWKPAAAALGMGGVILLLPPLGVAGTIVVGVVAFAAILMLLGAIRWKDGRPVVEL